MDSMAIYDTIKEIYFCLDYGDRQLLDRFNLTVPRFYLMKHISENPGLTLTQLSERMISDKSNITRLIQALESEGLVSRQRHETDRRAWSLFLTDEGAGILTSARQAHSAYTKERFEALDSEGANLLCNLQEIKRTLEENLES